MNKKFLISAAIAVTLILTACVKKEAPKDDEQETPVETTQPEIIQPELQEMPSATDSEIPTRVEVEQQESDNTSTTIRREYRDAPTEEPAVQQAKPEPTKPAAVKPAVEKPAPQAQSSSSSSSSSSQSEDDAVAAAIAAATPALNN